MNAYATLQTKKIELIQWLSTVEDVDILQRISDLISSERKKDWWKEISDEEKSSIKKGLNDAENGRLNPHSKARKVYGKWL